MMTAYQKRFINGCVKTIGYLGNLRITPEYQGHFLPLKAMDFLHENEASGEAEFFFSAISKENITPRVIFYDHPRPSFPRSVFMENIYTAGIIVGLKKRYVDTQDSILKGSVELLDDIINFLNREGSHKNLFPCYKREDFENNGLTEGFKIEDMRIAYRNNEIVGIMGYWDQSGFKQSVITSYNSFLKVLKPIYNVISLILSPFGLLPPLPDIGEEIKSAYGAFMCIKNDDPELFKNLLNSVYNIAVKRGKHYLLVGLTESDPLLHFLKKNHHISYHSSIYLYSLKDDPPQLKAKEVVPYVEIAAL